MMMKRILTTLILAMAALPMWACEVCKDQQPAMLRGITHGTGPQHSWDMPIIIVSAIIVLITLAFSVKYIFWPGEKSENHIKRSVLHNSL